MSVLPNHEADLAVAPWHLKQVEGGSALLPGLPLYEFTREPDASILCFAQTDLDALYPRYPGLKKAIAKNLREFPTANQKSYFKTKPNENRADFSACFSNNATNGKCLVPLVTVQKSIAELGAESELRRESIASFVSRMTRHEKEWVMHELLQSMGGLPPTVAAAAATTTTAAAAAPLAPFDAFGAASASFSAPTPALSAAHSAGHSPVLAGAAVPPPPLLVKSEPPQSFFSMFVRQRGLGAAADATAADFLLDEAEQNPLFGSMGLFGGALEPQLDHEHKRKRKDSLETDELPSLTASSAVAAAAAAVAPPPPLAAMPPLRAAPTSFGVPMRDRQWVPPVQNQQQQQQQQYFARAEPVAVDYAADDATEYMQRDGSLLFGLHRASSSPTGSRWGERTESVAAPAAQQLMSQIATELFFEPVAVPAPTQVAAPQPAAARAAESRELMMRGLRSLKSRGRAAFR